MNQVSRVSRRIALGILVLSICGCVPRTERFAQDSWSLSNNEIKKQVGAPTRTFSNAHSAIDYVDEKVRGTSFEHYELVIGPSFRPVTESEAAEQLRSAYERVRNGQSTEEWWVYDDRHSNKYFTNFAVLWLVDGRPQAVMRLGNGSAEFPALLSFFPNLREERSPRK